MWIVAAAVICAFAFVVLSRSSGVSARALQGDWGVDLQAFEAMMAGLAQAPEGVAASLKDARARFALTCGDDMSLSFSGSLFTLRDRSGAHEGTCVIAAYPPNLLVATPDGEGEPMRFTVDGEHGGRLYWNHRLLPVPLQRR
jgi:hypothetical protein